MSFHTQKIGYSKSNIHSLKFLFGKILFLAIDENVIMAGRTRYIIFLFCFCIYVWLTFSGATETIADDNGCYEHNIHLGKIHWKNVLKNGEKDEQK